MSSSWNLWRSMVSVLLLSMSMMLFSSNPWPRTAEAAKILGLFAHPSESHFAVMRTLMTELARREHNVTVISSHRLDERIENLEEIIVEPEFQFWHELEKVAGVKTGGVLELSRLPEAALQRALATVGAAATDHFLSDDRVQRRLVHLAPADFDYDLIVVDLFYTEALLAVGEHFGGRPTVAVVSSNFEQYMGRVVESLVPAACPPFEFGGQGTTNGDGDGFWKRLSTVRRCIARRRQFVSGNFAAQQKLIRKHFPQKQQQQHKASLTIPELQSRLAVVLLNNHVPVATPRPLLPNLIPAGGLHIRPPRQLPWHLRRFLDESRNGVVYVNLGNELQCRDIPKPMLALLLAVLGRGQERVLWTCHDVEKFEGMSKNMMVQHMVPQTDILAHPHVKLFLMNGDLLALQEAIVRHVPVVGIPIFSEEDENMNLAERLRIGLKLSYSNLTEASLTWALRSVLAEEATHAVTIRQVSSAFRDRPLGALETSIYWMDYVLRHQGAAHIRTRGVAVTPQHQLHLFDLFVYYGGVGVAVVVGAVGVYLAAVFLWRRRQAEKLFSKLS